MAFPDFPNTMSGVSIPSALQGEGTCRASGREWRRRGGHGANLGHHEVFPGFRVLA